MQLAAVLQRTGKDEDAVDAIKHAQGQLSSLDEASRQVSTSCVCSAKLLLVSKCRVVLN